MSAEPRVTAEPQLKWRIRLLLGCYPPWWRVRYDDEMRDTVVALRDEGRWTAAGSRDLLRGLVPAWINPAAVPDNTGMPERDRRLMPFAAWGLLLFVLGGSGFAKMLEYPEFTSAADRHPLLALSLKALAGAATCTAVVMSVATVVAIVSVMRRRTTRWQTVKPLLAVPLGLVALPVALVIARGVAGGAAPSHGRQVVAFLVLVMAAVVSGLICTVALMRAALRVPENRAVAVSRRIALLSVGVLTSIGALTVLAWTLDMAFESPGLLREHEGLVSTPTMVTLVACLTALLAGAGSCLRATLGVMGSPRRHAS